MSLSHEEVVNSHEQRWGHMPSSAFPGELKVPRKSFRCLLTSMNFHFLSLLCHKLLETCSAPPIQASFLVCFPKDLDFIWKPPLPANGRYFIKHLSNVQAASSSFVKYVVIAFEEAELEETFPVCRGSYLAHEESSFVSKHPRTRNLCALSAF